MRRDRTFHREIIQHRRCHVSLLPVQIQSHIHVCHIGTAQFHLSECRSRQFIVSIRERTHRLVNGAFPILQFIARTNPVFIEHTTSVFPILCSIDQGTEVHRPVVQPATVRIASGIIHLERHVKSDAVQRFRIYHVPLACGL